MNKLISTYTQGQSRGELDNILIAEDNESIQEIYHRLLIPHFNVFQCYDGKTAYEWFKLQHKVGNPFDAILTDNEMPQTIVTGKR